MKQSGEKRNTGATISQNWLLHCFWTSLLIWFIHRVSFSQTNSISTKPYREFPTYASYGS